MADPAGGIELLRTKQAARAWSRARKREGREVALVPTMGFLHDGHLALAAAARARGCAVVVSIYVNPTQFAPGEDFATYPRDPEGDRAKLAGKADAVFEPESLYEDDVHETFVTVEKLQKGLCGISRPHFFRGVATVVSKLFNIAEPDVAFFGRKDYQQWRVICRMVKDLDFDVEIVGMPLVREPDGIAMSSRNVRLSADERQRALAISRALGEVQRAAAGGADIDVDASVGSVKDAIAAAGGDVDYVSAVHPERLVPVAGRSGGAPFVVAVAARFGTVRLLDNMEMGGAA